MPEQDEEFLQVYMVHDVTITRFKQWVNEQGWELQPIPRFDESDDTYVKTHMIVPKNLDQLMRSRVEHIIDNDGIVMHYWGREAKSPCGRDVASAYSTNGHGYTSEWTEVDCPTCLKQKP